MFIIDAHCDTLSKWVDGNFVTQFRKNELHGGFLQVFAAFIGEEGAYQKRVLDLIDCYDTITGFNKIYTAQDILGMSQQDTGALLAVEGAEAVGTDIENLFRLYDRGVRMLGLSWNNNNAVCCAAMAKEDAGLTAFGRRVVKAAEQLGIIIDLSHVSQKSFFDVTEIVSKPVVASHSNAYSVCAHRRNLTDDQFLSLIKNGGVAGINLYPPFLTNASEADFSDIIRHIDHFLSLGGEDNIGIGSDFDGIKKLPKGISSTADIYKLVDMLFCRYSAKIAEKISGGNFKRVFLANLVSNM